MDAELTIIMVSYNTRDITLRALETLFENAGDVAVHVVVWDNDSHDGSAEAIAAAFPEVELIRSAENIGFAAANNRVAENADTKWLLLLNPDTETHKDAIASLLAFAKAHPKAGIVGGRTVYPNGSLNEGSCYNRMTPWSLFSSAFGLNYLFPHSAIFNAEAIGGWGRDSVRQVDIVVGCFFLIERRLWNQLGGFREHYFMYGEEADMCLRAGKLGYRPMITPDAEIMHMFGASSPKRSDKIIMLMTSRSTLIRDHWNGALAPLGLGLMWLWGATRRLGSLVLSRVRKDPQMGEHWRAIWSARSKWLAGHQRPFPEDAKRSSDRI